MLVNAVPVLPALNINETVAFYENHLGFLKRHQDAEYAILTKDTIEIHFWRCEDKYIAENCSCRVNVTDIEALYQVVKAQGILRPDCTVEVKPWGVKEFEVFDPSGNLVWFCEGMKE